MRGGRILIRPGRRGSHSGLMDLIALVLAVAFFAAMLLFIEVVDRV
jgi:hypothetical protein